jgi:alpha-tubulin suppressor-like RCC1 family protein
MIAGGPNCFLAAAKGGGIVQWGELEQWLHSDLAERRLETTFVNMNGEDRKTIEWRPVVDRFFNVTGNGFVRSLAVGNLFCIALINDGRVIAWGPSEVASKIPRGLADVAEIAASDDIALILMRDGTVKEYRHGPEPDGGTAIPVHLTGVKKISVSQSHRLALLSNGVVASWGSSQKNRFHNVYYDLTVPDTLNNVESIQACPSGGWAWILP